MNTKIKKLTTRAKNLREETEQESAKAAELKKVEQSLFEETLAAFTTVSANAETSEKEANNVVATRTGHIEVSIKSFLLDPKDPTAELNLLITNDPNAVSDGSNVVCYIHNHEQFVKTFLNSTAILSKQAANNAKNQFENAPANQAFKAEMMVKK